MDRATPSAPFEPPPKPQHVIDALEAPRQASRSKPHRRRTRATLARRAVWLGATLLGIEILYLIAGNLFLCFGLRRVVSRSPDHTMMAYESAYTTFPGVAHVRGFRMRNQDQSTQWVLDIDEAHVTIELRDLVHQSFHASRVRASGVSFRLRRKLGDDAAKTRRAAAVPPIPGFEDPPRLPIGPPVNPETAPAGWTANLEDVLASVSEVWVDEWRLLGPATVRGGFFKSRRTLQVGPATLEVRAGEARIGGESALAALEARVDALVGAVDMREPITRAVREISVRGTVDARVPSVDFLRLYLGVPAVLELEDGSGVLHAALDLRHGTGRPPSNLTFESSHLVLTRGELQITSSFSLAARVEPRPGRPVGTADLDVRTAAIALRSHEGEPPIVEHGRVHFAGLTIQLAEPVKVEHTTVDLPVRLADLAWVLPRPRDGHERGLRLRGAATARLRAELDDRFVAAGTLQGQAERAEIQVRGYRVGARVSGELSFLDASSAAGGLVFRSGSVLAEEVAITHDGRTHPGGTARVDLLSGRVADGVPLDLSLTGAARHSDLSWIAYGSPTIGVRARAGELSAKLLLRYPASLFDGSPAQAEVTGEIVASASGAAHYGDTKLDFHLRTAATIEALDLGRRSLRLRGVHVTARDVTIDRGTSHTRGWWGTFDTPRFTGNLVESVELAASVDTRCQSGAPVNAILASAGVIPGWVGSIFPMNDLTVTGHVRLLRGLVDFGLRAHGSSATVTADLHHANAAAAGVVLVQTPVLSVGVELGNGKHQVKVFAGQAWLDERIRAVEAEEEEKTSLAR